MDPEQQAARIDKIVNSIAEQVIAMPPDDRSSYIQNEVERVRQAFLKTYEADARLRAYAMQFIDKMSDRINARVQALETETFDRAEAIDGTGGGRPERRK